MDKNNFHKYLNNVAALNGETQHELQNITDTYPWFQAGWLLYAKNLKNNNSSDFDNILKKVAVLAPDRKSFYKFLNSEKPKEQRPSFKIKPAAAVYELDQEKENNNGNSLIDKFLNSEQTVRKKRNTHGFASGTVLNNGVLEKSVEENDEIITETLATIYTQQKNYDKALNAYQKLSLKFPEKSVYFASRIKEIKVLKNNI